MLGKVNPYKIAVMYLVKAFLSTVEFLNAIRNDRGLINKFYRYPLFFVDIRVLCVHCIQQ